MPKNNWIATLTGHLRIPVLLLLLILLIQGCATRKEIQQFQQDHQDFRAWMESFDAYEKKLDKRLDELNSRLDTLEALLGGNVGDRFKTTEAFLRGMRADQRLLNGDIERSLQTLAARNSNSDIHIRKFVAKLDEVNRLVNEIIQQRDSLKVPRTFALNDPEKLYNQSYLDLIQGEPELARMGFQQFVMLYPSSSMADNATYWIAESFMAEQITDSAKTMLKKVFNEYPASSKRPTAMLKLSILLAAEGNTKEAENLLKKIASEYPVTLEAKQAKNRLKELQKQQQTQQKN